MSDTINSQPNRWPEVRKERVRKLLPQAMKRAGIDSWVVFCRENNNDPLAKHVGGENAGAPAAFLFFLKGERVESLALSPWGEAVACRELGLHDQVIEIERNVDLYTLVAEHLKAAAPQKIGVNSSPRGIADGLTWTQRTELERALGPEYSQRLVSSEDIVFEWLSVKLPQEVDIMRQAGLVTVALMVEAYKAVVPGVTRDIDVFNDIKRRMAEKGLADSWAPEMNPAVNSGFPRGHASTSEKIIRPGDFIQTDFGIKIDDTWCTDYQRFAYVLAPGETTPPPAAQQKWEYARQGHRKVQQGMKPGMTGYEADAIQRQWMRQTGCQPVKWGTGHAVGYWAHDCGPYLGGGQYTTPPSGDAVRVLRPGQTFAYDGFYAWEEEKDGEKGVKMLSVEEMVVVTETGAEYLIPPQEELILIPSPAEQ